MKTFEEYVTTSILANNEFGIKSVNHLESLNSMALDRKTYPQIEALIKQKDFEKIRALPFGDKDFEHLDILKFEDQNNKPFVVTVYSNDSLESDPQVINIFSTE